MSEPLPAFRIFKAATVLEWLEWRRMGVGSSDSPAILGVCPHGTRLKVYLSKIQTRIEEGDDDDSLGNDLEPVIAKWYTKRTGYEIVEHQHLIESEIHPWLRSSVDCIRSDGRAVELKSLGIFTANNFRAKDGDWESLPPSWIVQCHHQMIVLDHDVIDMAVLYPLEVRVYTIPRSEKLCRLILDQTVDFWECVCDRVPPRTLDPRDHERIEEAYPRAEGEITLIDPELIDAAWKLEQDAKDKAAKVMILDAMGEAAIAELPDGTLLRRDEKVIKEKTIKEHTRTTLKIERRQAPCISR